MGVRSRRPKNELRVGVRMEVDRAIRRLEDRQFAGFHALRDTKAPRAHRDPANRMVDGRLIAPGLASSQAQSQVVQRGRKGERTRRPAVGPDQDTRRAVARDGVRCQVDVFHGSELMLGRQREPELEATRTVAVAASPAVPGSVTGLEPFNPACPHDVRSLQSNLRNERFPRTGTSPSRCPSVDAGRSPGTKRLQVEEIQEDERFQHLTKVAGAHQPRDRAVAAASGPADDPPRPRLDRRECGPVSVDHLERRRANCERRPQAIRAAKARSTRDAVGAV